MKTELESIYRNHHERGGRYGYLFCGGARTLPIREWIGTGKRILDLGCRDGALTASYAADNEVEGVDIDRRALELIQERLGIKTHWIDLNSEWPFAKQSFDVIVACELMEHLYVLDRFLDQVKATLKPGGLFIGSVPNAFRMRNRAKFLFGEEYEKDPTHVRQFSPDKLKKTLENSFIQVEIVPIGGKIFPFIPVSSATPAFLNRLFAKDLLWKAVAKEG